MGNEVGEYVIGFLILGVLHHLRHFWWSCHALHGQLGPVLFSGRGEWENCERKRKARVNETKKDNDSPA